MGRNMVELKVTATLSAHNDERDDRDEALWDELRDRISALVNDPRYEPVSPMVF